MQYKFLPSGLRAEICCNGKKRTFRQNRDLVGTFLHPLEHMFIKTWLFSQYYGVLQPRARQLGTAIFLSIKWLGYIATGYIARIFGLYCHLAIQPDKSGYIALKLWLYIQQLFNLIFSGYIAKEPYNLKIAYGALLENIDSMCYVSFYFAPNFITLNKMKEEVRARSKAP